MDSIRHHIRNFFGGWYSAATDPTFWRRCREEDLWPHQVEQARYAYELDRLRRTWVERVYTLATAVLDLEEAQTYGKLTLADDPKIRNVQASLPHRRFLLNSTANSYLFVRIKGFGDNEITVDLGKGAREQDLSELRLRELRDIFTAVQWRPW